MSMNEGQTGALQQLRQAAGSGSGGEVQSWLDGGMPMPAFEGIGMGFKGGEDTDVKMDGM